MHKILIAAVCLVVLSACGAEEQGSTKNEKTETNQAPDMHTSKLAIDYNGYYKGMLPCADCDGIVMAVWLNEDNTYKIYREYLGKEDAVFEGKGQFTWSEDGGIIYLKDEEQPNGYRVGENQLIKLDSNDEPINDGRSDLNILYKAG
jgi:uncharacterized lipoprotein NlpE involved in copper resistance